MATFAMRHMLKNLEAEGKSYDLVQKKNIAWNRTTASFITTSSFT